MSALREVIDDTWLRATDEGTQIQAMEGMTPERILENGWRAGFLNGIQWAIGFLEDGGRDADGQDAIIEAMSMLRRTPMVTGPKISREQAEALIAAAILDAGITPAPGTIGEDILRRHGVEPAVEDGCGIRHAPIPEPGGIEVRDPDDEIVAHGAFIHIERLDDDRVWLSIQTPNGQEIHLDVYAISRKRVGMMVRDEGDTPTPIPREVVPVPPPRSRS